MESRFVCCPNSMKQKSSGSRYAAPCPPPPHLPESLASVNIMFVARDGLIGTPTRNWTLLVHHSDEVWSDVLSRSCGPVVVHEVSTGLEVPSEVDVDAICPEQQSRPRREMKTLAETADGLTTRSDTRECLEFSLEWGIASLWKGFARGSIPTSLDWLLVQERKSIVEWSVSPSKELHHSDSWGHLNMETGLLVFSLCVMLWQPSAE